jgi:hypothetical protein
MAESSATVTVGNPRNNVMVTKMTKKINSWIKPRKNHKQYQNRTSRFLKMDSNSRQRYQSALIQKSVLGMIIKTLWLFLNASLCYVDNNNSIHSFVTVVVTAQPIPTPYSVRQRQQQQKELDEKNSKEDEEDNYRQKQRPLNYQQQKQQTKPNSPTIRLMATTQMRIRNKNKQHQQHHQKQSDGQQFRRSHTSSMVRQ